MNIVLDQQLEGDRQREEDMERKRERERANERVWARKRGGERINDLKDINVYGWWGIEIYIMKKQ